MPFGLWTRMGCKNQVLDGSSGVQFAISGFVGYNYGCMIASDTLFHSTGGFLGLGYPMKT